MDRTRINPSRLAPPAASMGRRRFLYFAFTAVTAWIFGPFARRADAAGEPLKVPSPQKPWDKVEFSYAGSERSFPGIAVRLPATAGGGLCAVCRICPHEGCTFGYETDYETVGGIIGKDLDHPVFFCRCHFSTFDPAKDGNLIYGPSRRPPWRFMIREESAEMIITGIEPGAGELG